jgi:hypothetical protein
MATAPQIDFTEALKQSIKGYTCKPKKLVLISFMKHNQKVYDVTNMDNKLILEILTLERELPNE